jgi:DNA-directed RNA polymerase specialized sigma24 family protein
MSGEEAVAWVDRYRRLVERHIRQFMVNTPYDREDYLHDAYEAALVAASISARKGISFSAVFWLTFRRIAARVSSAGYAKWERGDSSDGFDFLEYSDEVFYGADMHPPDSEERFLSGYEPCDTEKIILLRLLERLMPVERKVLSCICGLQGGRMSYTETALFLGMSHGAVSQSFRRIMRKAFQFRADCARSGLTPCRSDR